MPDKEDTRAPGTATLDAPAATPVPQGQAAPAAGKPASPAKEPVAQAPVTEEAPTPDGAEDWERLVETVDPEKLRRHPRVSGLVGTMVEQAMQRERQRHQETWSRQAAADAERRLIDLAEKDPYAFAQKYLTDAQAKSAQADLTAAQESLRAQESAAQAHRFANSIGLALKDVPEWKEMEAKDFEELTKAVGDEDDPEVVFKKYLPKAIGKVASKQAERLYQERYAKDLEKEVEARVKEREAERRAKSSRPDLRAAKSAPDQFDPTSLGDRDFDKWYEENVLGKL